MQTHSNNHSIAKNLNELLMHEPHVACAKKSYCPWSILLDGK